VLLVLVFFPQVVILLDEINQFLIAVVLSSVTSADRLYLRLSFSNTKFVAMIYQL